MLAGHLHRDPLGDESHQVVLELLNAGAIAYIRKGVTASRIAKTLADALLVKGGPQAGTR